MDDTRDLRDPQALGAELLRNKRPNRPLSVTADEIKDYLSKVSNYPQDELLSTVTARDYRRELEARAKEGDKYARSVLETGRPLE